MNAHVDPSFYLCLPASMFGQGFRDCLLKGKKIYFTLIITEQRQENMIIFIFSLQGLLWKSPRKVQILNTSHTK